MAQPSGQLALNTGSPFYGYFWYANDSTTPGLWDARNGAMATKVGTGGITTESGAKVVNTTGSTSFTLPSALDLTGDFTIGFRVRLASGAGQNSMVCGNADAGANFVWLNSNTGTTLRIRANSAETDITYTAPTTLDTYHLTRAANVVKAYKNGTLLGTMSPNLSATLTIKHILRGYLGTYDFVGVMEFFHLMVGTAIDATQVASLAADPYQLLVAAAGPTINTQPSSQTVTTPATASFTVAATASAGSLGYQWQRSTNGGSSWSNVSTGTGGTSASYTTAATSVSGGNANNADQYRCAVTDSNGTTTSSAATLTVNAAAASLTSSALKNNAGVLHLSAAFEAFVLNSTTGALVVRKTGLTSHASTGVVTFTDAALAAATQYRVLWRRTDTGAQGVELLTAA